MSLYEKNITMQNITKWCSIDIFPVPLLWISNKLIWCYILPLEIGQQGWNWLECVWNWRLEIKWKELTVHLISLYKTRQEMKYSRIIIVSWLYF